MQFAGTTLDAMTLILGEGKVIIARRMAGIADALRSGDTVRAQAMTDRIVSQFPAVKGGLKIVGRGAAMLGRDLQSVPLAATDQSDAK